MKRLKHLPVVLGCAAISFFLLPVVVPFGGMGTPSFVLMVLTSLLVTHLIGLIIGLIFVKVGWRSATLVCVVCLAPLAPLGFFAVQDHIYLTHHAAADRFRDNLIAPIPSSVTNLDFVPLDQSIETHLMLVFEIAPPDLERIIEANGYKLIDAEFRRQDDLFTCPGYIPLDGDVTFYQASDEDGEGFTLKVSGDRRKVIFRRESAAYYHYRYWENPMSREEEEAARAKLGCR